MPEAQVAKLHVADAGRARADEGDELRGRDAGSDHLGRGPVFAREGTIGEDAPRAVEVELAGRVEGEGDVQELEARDLGRQLGRHHILPVRWMVPVPSSRWSMKFRLMVHMSMCVTCTSASSVGVSPASGAMIVGPSTT